MAYRITKQEFVKAVSEGLSISEVAIKFDCVLDTVRNWERRFGVRCRRRKKANALDKKTLTKLAAEGLNTAQIAGRLNVTRNSVWYYLRKYGIPYNPERVGGLKIPAINMAKFAEKLLGKFGNATVRVKGKVVMRDGKLVGEEGKRWLEEKVKAAFPRRGQHDH